MINFTLRRTFYWVAGFFSLALIAMFLLTVYVQNELKATDAYKVAIEYMKYDSTLNRKVGKYSHAHWWVSGKYKTIAEVPVADFGIRFYGDSAYVGTRVYLSKKKNQSWEVDTVRYISGPTRR